MNGDISQNAILSVIVPISSMAERLNLIQDWLKILEFQPVEVILVHDQNDMKTSLELNSLISKHQNTKIIFIEEKIGSPGLARNRGLKVASGDWVVFWDSDDEPNVIEILKILADYETTANFDVIIGQFRVYDCAIRRLLPERKPDLSLKAIAMNPGLWRMLFRRNIILSLKFNKFRMAEDQNFLSDIMLPERKFKIIKNIFYTYYINNENQLTKNKDAINEIVNAAAYTFTKIKSSKSINRNFDCTLFVRQIMTGIKKGNFLTKLQCVILLSKALILFRISTSFDIIKNIIILTLHHKIRKISS